MCVWRLYDVEIMELPCSTVQLDTASQFLFLYIHFVLCNAFITICDHFGSDAREIERFWCDVVNVTFVVAGICYAQVFAIHH